MTFGPQHQVRDVSEKLAVCDPYFDDASKGLVNNAARLEEANSTNPTSRFDPANPYQSD
jgi:hypothetical protein